MSISTRGGDGGSTRLPGGRRVPKSDPRLDACGTIDELVAHIGFARSICADADVRTWLEQIQRDLFRVGAVVAADPSAEGPPAALDPQCLPVLDEHVRRVESVEGLLRDWALPGGWPPAAALDVARTVCRRAERAAVRLFEEGLFSDQESLRYLNRLSDVLWLFSRLLELRAGAKNSLRDQDSGGSPWSKAW